MQLYGFMVEDQSGKRKLFYSDSEEDRDGWYWYFQNQATKQARPSPGASSRRSISTCHMLWAGCVRQLKLRHCAGDGERAVHR